METFAEAEAVVFRSCAGGGYGDPLDRDPDRVALDVNRHWLSPEKASAVFGVVLAPAANGIDWQVDRTKTNALRAAVRPTARQ